MTKSKYFDKQVICAEIIFGIIGGGLMLYLSKAEFGLYYLHGYLFIIHYLLIMIVGLTVYKKLTKEKSTYLKRLITGFLICALTTICFIISHIIFGTHSNKGTFENKVFDALIIIAFGFILSSFLALLYSSRNKSKLK
jgi:multisubunit Na+/H+ antiporter MnhB subunit